MPLADHHRDLLTSAAISGEVIEASGITSNDDGTEILFPWSDGEGEVVWQRRPDSPRTDDEGRKVKYEFPSGAQIPLNRLRDESGSTRVIIAEGTKQQYAVLSHAPSDYAVYGMSGCWGWSNGDLARLADGREVYLLLDADYSDNPHVWAAADKLSSALKLSGASEVRYVNTPGTGTDGVDDVLSGLEGGKRGASLRRWLGMAADKLPARPKRKPKADKQVPSDAPGIEFFAKVDGRTSFQPAKFAAAVTDDQPVAVTAEGRLAFYRDGAYRLDPNALLATVTGKLSDFYNPSYLHSAEHVLKGEALRAGRTLPERLDKPWLNCQNTMVDLRTGKTFDHSPDHLSSSQVTVDYGPQVATPVYDAWLESVLRRPGQSDEEYRAMVEDLHETAGTMLDPSRTPSKALFLFGPSRSGKSTFLRLLKTVAGRENTSAVTLQNLGDDRFATANLYGKMLNVAADLPSSHVRDLSAFKMLTGEDVVTANRKYGDQFEFTNRALMAFSANELPTVSEASRAYAERMKPFEFPNTFAGREDKGLEPKLLRELPGILAKWVAAYSRYLQRGGYRSTDREVADRFESSSDRVAQFFAEMCEVTPAAYGDSVSDDGGTSRADVHQMFNAWAEANGFHAMGRNSFYARFTGLEGVVSVKLTSSRRRAFNVSVRSADADEWDDGESPEEGREAPGDGVEVSQIAAPPRLLPAAPGDGEGSGLLAEIAAAEPDPFGLNGSSELGFNRGFD